jgi:hypothetical protein
VIKEKMKRQIIAFLIALVVVTGLTVSVHSEETFDKNLGNYEVIFLL